MKCTECHDYIKCRSRYDLRIKRHRCLKAKEPKFYSNADHIRAMTDEELAWYMAKMLADYTTGLYDGSYVPSDKVVCEMVTELLRQLQQPHESEETP